jgi:hypothetical protein
MALSRAARRDRGRSFFDFLFGTAEAVPFRAHRGNGMAVTRTILPRKGLIQPQHGLTGYEADQDSNWLLLDANVAFLSDVAAPQSSDLGINGVVTGFTLSASSSLTPGLGSGVLYAQGTRYAPSAPVAPAAPASAASYLFYNSTSAFYYQAGAVGATPGDALVGRVVTSAVAVTSITQATRIYGQLSLAPAAPGNFSLAHLLGRAPLGAVVQMTSSGSIWFQPTLFDATHVYLVSSAGGITGKVQLW